MKFLFVTIFGESAALAQRLLEESHTVRFYIKDSKYQDTARGIIPRVRDWKKHRDWADVIVFDDVEMAKDIEWLREQEYLVIGGNIFGDRLENDRVFGQKIMNEAGIKNPLSRRFRSFANAITFVKKHPQKYVLKYNGQQDRHLCYIGRFPSGEDLIHILEHHQKIWLANKRVDFILQKVIDGIETSVGAFFNGQDFVYPVCITFEHKHFGAGGVGPLTGEMGTSMFYSPDGGKLFKETLFKMQPYLQKTNYRGFIDINSIITKNGAYAIEFTSRFGYPQLDIQLDMHKTSWGELLHQVASGTLKNFEVFSKFGLGVIIGGAGMPYDISYNKYGRNLPIFGINKKNARQVKLLQAYKKNDKFYCGPGGYPLTITGCGNTMAEAQQSAYDTVKQIIIPNAVYRLDIGDHWKKEAPLLKKWGYL